MPKAQATPGKTLLSPGDHTLIMIDHQSQMSFATHSIDAATLRTNVALVAHAAAVWLSAAMDDGSGWHWRMLAAAARRCAPPAPPAEGRTGPRPRSNSAMHSG